MEKKIQMVKVLFYQTPLDITTKKQFQNYGGQRILFKMKTMEKPLSFEQMYPQNLFKKAAKS